MSIGALGDIPFIVSADTMRTFRDLQRNTAARWAKHEILGFHPKPEYIGADLDTVSFTMRFDVSFGMNPRKEMDKLLNLARIGRAVPLVIGKGGLGTYKWVVKSVTMDWKVVDNQGNLLVGEAAIELEEYPPEVPPQPKSKNLPNPVPCDIEVNGKKLQNKGFVQNGQSLAPVREVAESLGKKVTYEKINGQEVVTVDGQVLDVVVKEGVSYAWSRELGDSLGALTNFKNGNVTFD